MFSAKIRYDYDGKTKDKTFYTPSKVKNDFFSWYVHPSKEFTLVRNQQNMPFTLCRDFMIKNCKGWKCENVKNVEDI